MAVNESYANGADALADAGELIVDGSGAGTGAVNITELGGGGDCEIYREYDVNGDGTWAVSTLMDSKSGTWHSQDNDLLASQGAAVRLRIVNVSGGTADVWAVGYEVDN